MLVQASAVMNQSMGESYKDWIIFNVKKAQFWPSPHSCNVENCLILITVI